MKKVNDTPPRLRWLFLQSTPRGKWGGLENWMLKLARGLHRVGDRCMIVADPATYWPDVCQREGLEFARFHLGFEASPIGFARLAIVLRKCGPDIVLCTSFREARRVRHATHRPVIGMKLHYLRSITDSFLDRWSFRYAVDRVFTDHGNATQLLLRYPWVLPGKIVVAPNGVDVDPAGLDPSRRRAARSELGVDNPDEVVVAVACPFTAEKRVMDAVRVFRRARVPGVPARLVLMGDGPQRRELERAVGPEASDVVFLGWREDAADLLHGCDVVLHTSISQAMPNSVLEGMAAGAVVLATRAGGTEEVITSGEDGFLFECGDIDAMAACLRDLICNPAKRRQIGEAAHRRVARSFSMQSVVDRIRSQMHAVVVARRMLHARSTSLAPLVRCVSRPRLDEALRVALLDALAGREARTPARGWEIRTYGTRAANRFGRGALLEPRALKWFRLAHRLELMGVAVSPHLAAAWVAGLRRARSALAVRGADRAAPAAEWVETHRHHPSVLALLASSAGSWLANLHALGIAPGRLDARAVWIRAGAALRPEFFLHDLEACRIRRHLGRRAMAANFAYLYRIFSHWLPPTSMLRFVAAYRRTRGLSRRTVRHLLAVAARSTAEVTTGPGREPVASSRGRWGELGDEHV